MRNFDEIKKEIIDKIQQKAPLLQCPVCHTRNVILVDGFINHSLQKELVGVVIGGPSIPTVGLVCSNCGYLMEFSVGVLGLLPKKADEVNDAKH